jgi:hypothetical protein
VEGRDLLRVGTGDQRRLRRIAFQSEQLAPVTGRNHQPAFTIERDVVR